MVQGRMGCVPAWLRKWPRFRSETASFSHEISPFRTVDNLTDRGSLCTPYQAHSEPTQGLTVSPPPGSQCTPIINITIIYHPDDHHPPHRRREECRVEVILGVARRKGWPPPLFDENPLYIRTSSLYKAHHKDGINNGTLQRKRGVVHAVRTEATFAAQQKMKCCPAFSLEVRRGRIGGV